MKETNLFITHCHPKIKGALACTVDSSSNDEDDLCFAKVTKQLMCCVRFVYFHCRAKGRKLNSLAREFRRHIRSAILVSVDVVNIFK